MLCVDFPVKTFICELYHVLILERLILMYREYLNLIPCLFASDLLGYF
jgi:hypothetical protein